MPRSCPSCGGTARLGARPKEVDPILGRHRDQARLIPTRRNWPLRVTGGPRLDRTWAWAMAEPLPCGIADDTGDAVRAGRRVAVRYAAYACRGLGRPAQAGAWLGRHSKVGAA